MDKICRLCFSVTDQALDTLSEDSETMYKLNSCLSLEINLTEPFPRQICEGCTKKVEEIHKFREKVLHNELKLLQHLNGDSLKRFYSSLTDKLDIKIEVTNRSSEVKKEDSSDLDSNDCIISYFTEHSFDLHDIKTEKEHSSSKNNKANKLNGTSKVKRKPLNKKPLKTNLKTPKVIRKVIRKDKYAEHDPNKCLTCFTLCDSTLNLSRHYKTEHSIEPGHLKAEKDCDVSDKYTVHRLDGQKPSYKCNTCGDSDENLEDIIRHVILHMYERPYVCKLCGKTYKTVYEIVRHGRVHSGFKLFCQHGCGYTSPYPGAMRDHEKRHTDQRNYSCKTCGKGFLVKTWYDQHQNIHDNIKPFVCDICGMAFHMHRYLVTHRNKRHPGLSAIRKYTCTKCTFSCDNKNGLTIHMEGHAVNPCEARLTLLCDLCGKGFARTDHLTNHKNGKHFGIKPYTCKVCNKQFQKKFNLTVHEKIHTGEGRHLCLFCGKFFAQKSTLYRHQKKRHPEEYLATKVPRSSE